MLIAVSDSHCREDPQLTSHLQQAIRDSDCTVHLGDFTTPAVLDAFKAHSNRLIAVAGNRDTEAVKKRLGETATVDWGGRRFLVTHGHRRGPTALSLLARQEAADVVLSGHSHRPVIDRLDDRLHVNPGSYADPRGNQPAYARFQPANGSMVVTLMTPTGEEVETSRFPG